MNIRERTEEQELESLSPYASCSKHSRGRKRDEDECDIRTVYQRDRDRILYSKSFRRLEDKTQAGRDLRSNAISGLFFSVTGTESFTARRSGG